MTNSADPDQLASSEANFDLDLHCLLRQGMSCSAKEGLRETSFVTSCLFSAHQASSEKESTPKEKNLIPIGANSFLMRLFPEGRQNRFYRVDSPESVSKEYLSSKSKFLLLRTYHLSSSTNFEQTNS